MKLWQKVAGAGMALAFTLTLASCRSEQPKLGADKLPENLGQEYEGTSTDGYTLHDTGKLIFDRNNKTISDGKTDEKYKVVDQDQLTGKTKTNSSPSEDMNTYYFALLQESVDEQGKYQFGYELDVSNDGKQIEVKALATDFDLYEFSGEVAK